MATMAIEYTKYHDMPDYVVIRGRKWEIYVDEEYGDKHYTDPKSECYIMVMPEGLVRSRNDEGDDINEYEVDEDGTLEECIKKAAEDLEKYLAENDVEYDEE